MLIYLASGNEKKLTRLQKLFSKIDPDYIVKQVPNYIDVEETGKYGFENSLLKIQPYIGKLKHSVVAGDTAVFFEKENFNPTHVRRVALKNHNENDLTQEEIALLMQNFYIGLAKKYGGQVDFHYIDYWTLLKPTGETKQISYKRPYILTDTPKGKLDTFFPMRSLYISKLSNKSFDQTTNEDYFLELKPQIDAFKKLIKS